MTIDLTKPTKEVAHAADEFLGRIDESLAENLTIFFGSFENDTQKQEALTILVNAACYQADYFQED